MKTIFGEPFDYWTVMGWIIVWAIMFTLVTAFFCILAAASGFPAAYGLFGYLLFGVPYLLNRIFPGA